MHLPSWALALALVAMVPAGRAQNATPAGPLTLQDAMRLAESASTAVRAREAQLATAEGERREAASPFFNNPGLSVERARRNSPADGRITEWTAGISQPLEIAGQQSRRRQAAAASIEALRSEIDAARRQARADAAARFHALLAAQRRVNVEQRSVEQFDRTSQAVSRRRSAGEDTRLDANVALIEAERARNALARAREQLLEARGELATLLQLPSSVLPEVTGDLVAPSATSLPYTSEQLLAAVQTLPRQRAWASRVDEAQARLALARAGRYPDVTVGVNVAREGPPAAREKVTTLAISLPLPLFKRNDAAIGQALTALDQAEIDRAAGIRDAEAGVRRLWLRLDSQRERVQRLQRTMMDAALDNQQLAARSRQAGQIGLLEQLIVNRQALDAERELIDALADFHATRIELEGAAGWQLEGSK